MVHSEVQTSISNFLILSAPFTLNYGRNVCFRIFFSTFGKEGGRSIYPLPPFKSYLAGISVFIIRVRLKIPEALSPVFESKP